MAPAFARFPFSMSGTSPTVVLGTSEVPVAGTLVAIEILTATQDAQIWAFDSATGSTAPPLAQSSNLGGILAPGVSVGFNRAFTNGLTLLCAGSVSGCFVVQVVGLSSPTPTFTRRLVGEPLFGGRQPVPAPRTIQS
jgi:hypothetical protein